MNNEYLIAAVKQVLNSVPAVYAYIAGSMNTPFFKESSDIDLVVIWEDKPTLEQRNKFISLFPLNLPIEWSFLDTQGEIIRDAVKFANLNKIEIYHHTYSALEYALQTQYEADGLAYSIANRLPLILNEAMEEYINSHQKNLRIEKQNLAFSVMDNLKKTMITGSLIHDVVRLYSFSQWNSVPAQKHWKKIIEMIPNGELLLDNAERWLNGSIGLVQKWGDTAPPLILSVDENSHLKKYDPTIAPLIFEKIEAQRTRLQEYLSWPKKIKTLEDQEAFGRQADLQWDQGQAFHYQIFEENVFQGAISIHSMNYSERSFEFGYWVDQDSEGKGYISKGLEALMKEMKMAGWKIARIRTQYGNIKSQRVPARTRMSLSKEDSSFLYYERVL